MVVFWYMKMTKRKQLKNKFLSGTSLFDAGFDEYSEANEARLGFNYVSCEIYKSLVSGPLSTDKDAENVVIELGAGYGQYDVPVPVARYVMELAQTISALLSRVDVIMSGVSPESSSAKSPKLVNKIKRRNIK